MERRLVAILAADVLGFSRQMGTDEAHTLARIAALWTGVLERVAAQKIPESYVGHAIGTSLGLDA